ncbi:MAG TPA: hypothetical protein VMB79_18385 [Jatrophihabitans sp.]|nr:hypothetical protein [Jatrophihabitans sp.]
MTGFQLTRSHTAVAPKPATWSQPAQTPTAELPGRHASALRAKLTLRRMFYAARHAAH